MREPSLTEPDRHYPRRRAWFCELATQLGAAPALVSTESIAVPVKYAAVLDEKRLPPAPVDELIVWHSPSACADPLAEA